MQILHQLHGNRGMFFIPADEEGLLAEVVYSLQPPNMIIEHTEVDEELRGQNVGFRLVNTIVEHARSHHYKIIPICPFVKSIMDKKPDYKDVLAE
ncbi:MAG: N-acetyltransferase [Bacteroidota bacterium]|nr:N-acetyltransferase [Flavisolibacter sp.]MDQ3843940.1 N-acetyltransferase [Bacteroidota bacterium]MBD0284258.1 N-acetyltransferase [Flavisolibacter sp.]MBD0296720.1 N-acetyltransferase [Flavisolibacter sp.]MBD0350006.1 N-acetyltransferase [Flavisolibacter sp.]